MKITPEFIKRFGSGANPNDTLCMAGYDWYVTTFGDTPQTVSSVIEEVRTQVAAETMDRVTASLALEMARGLKTNPEAIRLGGFCEELPEWKYGDQVFASVEAAQAARLSVETEIRNHPLRHVNVLRMIETEAGEVSAPVKHRSQIRPGQKVYVFDPETGTNIETADPYAEINRIVEQEVTKINNRPVFRKIRDIQENYEAWEPVA